MARVVELYSGPKDGELFAVQDHQRELRVPVFEPQYLGIMEEPLSPTGPSFKVIDYAYHGTRRIVVDLYDWGVETTFREIWHPREVKII